MEAVNYGIHHKAWPIIRVRRTIKGNSVHTILTLERTAKIHQSPLVLQRRQSFKTPYKNLEVTGAVDE